jgi:hypothetical protein
MDRRDDVKRAAGIMQEAPMTLPLAFLLVVLTIGVAIAVDIYLEV